MIVPFAKNKQAILLLYFMNCGLLFDWRKVSELRWRWIKNYSELCKNANIDNLITCFNSVCIVFFSFIAGILWTWLL